MGVKISNNSGIVTYDFDSGLKVNLFLNGNSNPNFGNKTVDYVDTLNLETRVAKIGEVAKGKIFHVTSRESTLGDKEKCLLTMCVDPVSQHMLQYFPRLPNKDPAQAETPFKAAIWTQRIKMMGMEFSLFNLNAEASKYINQSLAQYFSNAAKQQNWDELIQKKIDIDWKDSTIPAYESFSSLNWHCCSRYVLGIPSSDFVDFSYIWNNLFTTDTDLISTAYKYSAAMALHWKFFPFLLTLAKSSPAAEEGTLLHFWRENDFANNVIEKLSPEEKKQLRVAAEKRGVEIQEIIVAQNLLGVALGMQETVAYTLSEFLLQIQTNTELKNKAKDHTQFGTVLKDIMSKYPAAGGTREWQFDAQVTYNDQSYEFKKGELLGQHPIYTPQHPKPFGGGYHKCPGQTFAIPWMKNILNWFINNDNWKIKTSDGTPLSEVKHIVSFTTRHSPPLQLIIGEQKSGWATQLKDFLYNILDDQMQL